MPRKLIGIDLDDVLLDFNTALCEWHNLKYGTSYTRADIFSFDLKDVWKCPQEETNKRIVEFYNSEFHPKALPVPGTVEAIKKLKQNNDRAESERLSDSKGVLSSVGANVEVLRPVGRMYDLVIITSKPEYLREQTEIWLQKYFPNSFKSVHFTNSFHRNGSKRAKADVCDKLGVSVYIEDSIENAKAVVAPNREVLLFDTPWNQDVTPPGTIRVSSWEEIAERYK